MGFHYNLCLLTFLFSSVHSTILPASTKDWLIEFHQRVQPDAAKRIAKRYAMVSRGPVLNDERLYHFVDLKPTHAHTRKKRDIVQEEFIQRHELVKRAIHQIPHIRAKRGYRSPDEFKTDFPQYQAPTDPYFQHQWYLKNIGQAGGKPKLDLNVEEAWALGYTGKNVTTAIMDDGVDYTHPDLMHNYNAEASYDYSSNDRYPYPRYTDDWFNSHGTRCAGEVAAARDNNICGVGVAYDSKVAGIRMLDQPYMTDLIEANSMSHEPDMIDIYSASWGPVDDGKTVDGPRHATMKAIVKGINEGRRGLGSLYVWASGDGGANDDCNCDGYAASMWTISINSAINDGRTALYDESCSSTLASTFSNGRSEDPEAGVATTDLYGQCTLKHSGTSAAAPEAAGVFALVLEANRQLTWRDIQHLTVLTAKRNQLFDPSKQHLWHINGAGLEFNHLFGFGVLDAGDMVRHAKGWKPLPTRYHCSAGNITGKQPIPEKGSLKLTINTDACKNTKDEVNYLEHVQAFITLKSSRRGNTVIFITSPLGTRSLILSRRPLDDDSSKGYYKWPFMTTHAWAERAQGIWTLEIRFDNEDNANAPLTNQQNQTISDKKQSEKLTTGDVFEWSLVLHGTKTAPYADQIPLAIHENKSKLSITKQIHANNFQDKAKYVKLLKQDHQKRLGSDDEIIM
jgi:proprotein convertase subtilisin/kexin type 2